MRQRDEPSKKGALVHRLFPAPLVLKVLAVLLQLANGLSHITNLHFPSPAIGKLHLRQSSKLQILAPSLAESRA